MRRTSKATTVAVGGAAAFALACASPGMAHAATDTGRHQVSARPSWVAKATKTAATPGSQQQSAKVVLNLRNAAGAEALAAAVSDPSSPQHGKYVSAAAWRAQFAPTADQAKAVTSWLKSQGLKVGKIPANNRYIPITGSTAAMNKAFGTTLTQYSTASGHQVGPNSALSVPTSIAGFVAGVSGLDTTLRSVPLNNRGTATTNTMKSDKVAAPATAASVTAAPNATTVLPGPPAVFVNSGPCSAYYGEKLATGVPQLVKNPLTVVPCGYQPPQERSAYGVDQALSQGYDGRGMTIAIIDAFASPTIYADASTYANAHDSRHPLRSSQFNQLLPATYNSVDECGGNGWYGEETLDVEAAHAMAPGAKILYVGGESCQNDDLNAAMNSVVDNQLAQVISNSYGSTGEPTSMGDVALEHDTFMQAAAEGISVLFSSGDNGDEVANTGTRQVDYEASDPWVTAVGGTSLAIGKDGSYTWEQGWGTGKSTLVKGAWSPVPPSYFYGGGGGTSKLFAQPSYQKGVVQASLSKYFGTKAAMRTVPDIAMNADPQTGFLIGETEAFPNGSIKYTESRIGGTSLSCPLMAGEIAVASQVAGGPLGFLNPSLYKLAGTSAFHDVAHNGVTDAVVRTDFVNGVDASKGTVTTARTLNQTATLHAVKGYDDVTGLGSPNGVNFLVGLAQ